MLCGPGERRRRNGVGVEREGSNADRAILVDGDSRGVGVSEREWNCASESRPHIPFTFIFRSNRDIRAVDSSRVDRMECICEGPISVVAKVLYLVTIRPPTLHV